MYNNKKHHEWCESSTSLFEYTIWMMIGAFDSVLKCLIVLGNCTIWERVYWLFFTRIILISNMEILLAIEYSIDMCKIWDMNDSARHFWNDVWCVWAFRSEMIEYLWTMFL